MSLTRSILLTSAALAGSASAQLSSIGASTPSTTTTNTATTTASSNAGIHTVDVQYTSSSYYSSSSYTYFTPANLSALPGDTVRFRFLSSGESVIRAAYRYPCAPIESIYPGTTGFYSGRMSSGSYLSPVTWDLKINDTEPIWFYSGASYACSSYYAVGVINGNSSQKLSMQRTISYLQDDSYLPGEPISSSSRSRMDAKAAVDSNGTSTYNPYTYTGTSSGSGSGSGSSSSSGSTYVPLSTYVVGKIVGICIGVTILIASIVIGCWRRSAWKKRMRAQQAQLMAQVEAGQGPSASPQMVGGMVPSAYGKAPDQVTVAAREVPDTVPATTTAPPAYAPAPATTTATTAPPASTTEAPPRAQ